MAKVAALECVRCSARYPVSYYAQDCTACKATAPSNLVVVYAGDVREALAKPGAGAGRGLFRYGDVLPVSAAEVVSLGEGGSPLHHLQAAGAALGMANVHAKDETRNPTWSFKDRLACMAVSSARKLGARVVVSSSSGNAGAAAAAYAAKAGLPCVIFTFQGVAGPMVTQMCAYGARVVAVENKADRWTLMQMAVREYGWFPTSPFFGPAVGSNPFGIDGYKTLAYEMAEQLDWQVPDWVVAPVCYGDALIGIWRGFEDMMAAGWTARMPRMVAAEIYGSLTEAMQTGADTLRDMPRTHDSVGISIGATRGTYQALNIVRRSGGRALTLSNADMLRWQAMLAQKEGLFVEASSAGALAAIETLKGQGIMRGTDRVVALLTAGGLKDPQTAAREQAPPIAVPSDLAKAVRILKEHGLFPD